MVVRVSIYADGVDCVYHTWWRNFRSCHDMFFAAGIDHHLREYNGRDVQGTKYIEFETEEDATAFILRWS